MQAQTLKITSSWVRALDYPAKSYLIVVAILIFSAAYVIIVGSTVDQTTIQYDEYTDLTIASALSYAPLSGHSFDASQARFPMYATAVAARLLRLANPNLDLMELLPVSRWISIIMTVIAIWGTYLLGRRLFGVSAGLLAAAVFTFSPFVLHFGRDALTQGDAFTAATVVFTLIAFERFEARQTTFWLVSLAFCLALAIAAKFFLVFLVPALISYQLIAGLSRRHGSPGSKSHSANVGQRIAKNGWFILLSIVAGLSALFALLITVLQSGEAAFDSSLLNRAPRMLWALTLLTLCLIGLLALRDLGLSRWRSKEPTRSWNLGLAWLAILPISFAALLALFPVHIFNPAIMTALVGRFITMDGNSALLATSVDSIKLYFGLILFKLGLPFGILTVMAFVWALKEALRDRGALLLVVTLAFYGLMLAFLPLYQPFWLMSVYPLIVIVLSAMIVRVYNRLPNASWRPVWVGVIVIALIWLGIGLFRVYPTFGYYGYELIGNSWLGNSSRGFRAPITVTNDGSTETIEWLRRHAPAESTVVSYLTDVHLLNYLNMTEPLDFEFMQALKYGDESELNRDMGKADFLIIPLVNETPFSSPLSDPDFASRFAAEPVHQIVRGRGVYRMPVIQVYQRLASEDRLVTQ